MEFRNVKQDQHVRRTCPSTLDKKMQTSVQKQKEANSSLDNHLVSFRQIIWGSQGTFVVPLLKTEGLLGLQPINMTHEETQVHYQELI